MNEELRRLAEMYGIEPGYHAFSGEWRETQAETARALLAAMGVAANDAEQVERTLGAAGDIALEPRDFAVEQRAFRPEWLDSTRIWGLSCQLYGLRSVRNWGMGDFEDLARLAELAASRGADFLGVNPLHALFPADAGRFGPYAPSSRQFLNVLYIGPDRVPEYAQVRDAIADATATLAALRESDLIDYAGVYRAKAHAFAALHAAFRALPDESARVRDFAGFRRAGGDALQRQCLYDALTEHFAAAGGHVAWSQWPEDYRDPDSDEVAAFARANADRIGYYAWLQWIAAGQLAAAQARRRTARQPGRSRSW